MSNLKKKLKTFDKSANFQILGICHRSSFHSFEGLFIHSQSHKLNFCLWIDIVAQNPKYCVISDELTHNNPFFRALIFVVTVSDSPVFEYIVFPTPTGITFMCFCHTFLSPLHKPDMHFGMHFLAHFTLPMYLVKFLRKYSASGTKEKRLSHTTV